MASKAWERLIQRFGGTEGAREYARNYVRERRMDPEIRAAAAQSRKRTQKARKPLKVKLCLDARRRGRKVGMESTIRVGDLTWPQFCPVLGIELDYHTAPGNRRAHNPAAPSLDRWDNAKGYIPGNVFVISWRANALKGNATAVELEAVARYARSGV